MAIRDRSNHRMNLHSALSKALRGGLTLLLFARLVESYPKEAAVIRYFVDRFNTQQPLQWAAMLERDKVFKDEHGGITHKMALNLLERGAARIGVFDAATQELRSLYDEFRTDVLDLFPDSKTMKDASALSARAEELDKRLTVMIASADETTDILRKAEAKSDNLERHHRQAGAMFQVVRAMCANTKTASASRPLSELTYELERGDETRVRASVARLLGLGVGSIKSPSLLDLLRNERQTSDTESGELVTLENSLRKQIGNLNTAYAEARGTLEQQKERHATSQKLVQRLAKELTDLSLDEESPPDALDAKSAEIKVAMMQRNELRIAVDSSQRELYLLGSQRDQIEKELNSLPDRRAELSTIKAALTSAITLLERKAGLIHLVERAVPKSEEGGTPATLPSGILTPKIIQALRDLSLTPARFWGNNWTAAAWSCLVSLTIFTDLADLVAAWLAGEFEQRIAAGGPVVEELGKRKVIGRIRNHMTAYSEGWRDANGAYSRKKLGAFIAERTAKSMQA